MSLRLLRRARSIAAIVSAVCISAAQAGPLDGAQVERFIADMQRAHAFDAGALRDMFRHAVRLDSVLAAMSKPAEIKPWYAYRPIFITPERIKAGTEFWATHAATLEAASRGYGVPSAVICAIIGVETFYGRNTGSHRVVDALATLAFHFPSRGEFFRRELEQYLLLAREESVEPLSLKGSYAGAMGLPQFIPSSYRAYAIDFDHDGHRNIWSDPADAIGSVANYLQRHGWQPAQPIALPAVTSQANGALASPTVELGHTLGDFAAAGARPVAAADPALKAVLLAFEASTTDKDYWFGLKNFYVITRYNRSPKYALAVAELAGALEEARAAAGY